MLCCYHVSVRNYRLIFLVRIVAGGQDSKDHFIVDVDFKFWQFPRVEAKTQLVKAGRDKDNYSFVLIP